MIIGLFTSCGARHGQFKIEGRLLHINQGELYVYSPDGGMSGLDTIRIEAGRFAYETKMASPATLMLVFPNFSEHPVFAESGSTATVEADASHLKEMRITGTADNKLMTEFRKMVLNASPPEETRLAAQFISDHPESMVSIYLVRKYFVQSSVPDYRQAVKLLAIMKEAQPDNARIGQLHALLQDYGRVAVGGSLPSFTVSDIYGQTATASTLMSGVAVISLWSTWSFDSQEQQRYLRDLQKDSQGKLRLLSICVDGSRSKCEEIVERNNIGWPNVCDGDMMDGQLVKLLGFSRVPENIIIRNGKIVERGLNTNELRAKLQALL